MDFETKCVHSTQRVEDSTGAIATPIYQTATFAHEDLPQEGQTSGYDYTRQQNPTRRQLEYIVAELEGAEEAFAFASGMAAVVAVFETFPVDAQIICSGDLYGGTYRYFDQILTARGLNFTYENSTDALVHQILSQADSDPIFDAARAPARKPYAVYVETPTNPMMNVFDISRIAAAAHSVGALLVVDNTFLTPYFQRPMDLGADIVIHSGSKYLGGHNDTIAGLVAVKGESIADKLRFVIKTTGAGLAPFDAFLTIRGIKTLAVRMERAAASALVIARWLKAHDAVAHVYYPGLEDHPDYQTTLKQTSGFGAMISFTVRDADMALKVLRSVELISFAESLGGTESLITYPVRQTHADIPEKERLEIGITDTLLRLSVGLEAPSDLISDLERALA